MKFHHLARHSQFFGGPTAAAPHVHQQAQARDLSPIKSHLVQHQQLAPTRPADQQALAQHFLQHQHQQQHQQSNAAMSDDEDEDEDNPMSFYDSFLADQQRNSGSSQTPSGAQADLDSAGGGFLMDKNKKLFPQKLWELIHNPSIQHCLHWSQDGQRVYLNRNEFETYYLKTPNNQFHTQKAISFVRQMNMYGFRKVDDCYYENDNFRRDQQHLLKNMIRRHPNKGLFVGLDHHQLAAAAAAQQALQVNQQLQQLEHQHKHRAEQALRLNSYLNSHHQQHQSQHQSQHQHQHQPHQQHQFHNQTAQQLQPTNLTQHHSQISQLHGLKQHSSPFEQMSSRLAQAAVSQLTQHQQRQIVQQFGGENGAGNPAAGLAADQATGFPQPALSSTFEHNLEAKIENLSKHQQPAARMQNAQSASPTASTNQHSVAQIIRTGHSQHHLQHKKSRLLSNFYASSASQTSGVASDLTKAHGHDLLANQLILSQDSMHSSSSVDTQPSQRSGSSSAVNSVASASGSPQPDSPKQQAPLKAAADQANQQLAGKMRAPALNQEEFNRYLAHSNLLQQQHQQHSLAGQDLTSQSLAAAARQAALHQTLVRSLLQLKQQNHHSHHHLHHQDLLASLQQQQHQQHQQQQHQQHQQQLQQQHESRSLLESLASLSSVGTNSVIDPTSNSPTERTATPPSDPASPTSHEPHRYLVVCDEHQRATSVGQRRDLYDEHDDVALDLASKTANIHDCEQRDSSKASIKEEPRVGEEAEIKEAKERTDERAKHNKEHSMNEDEGCVVNGAESPLDGTRKVKKFLEDHQNHHHHRRIESEAEDEDDDDDDDDGTTADKIKRELDELIDVVVDERSPTSGAYSNDDDDEHEQLNSPTRKKLKTVDLDAMARSLVAKICDRRGDHLNELALSEAARYTGRFIEVLLEDASKIANSLQAGDASNRGSSEAEESRDSEDLKVDSPRSDKIIDSCTLSQALKSIPTKLVVALNLVAPEPRLDNDVNAPQVEATRQVCATIEN